MSSIKSMKETRCIRTETTTQIHSASSLSQLFYKRKSVASVRVASDCLGARAVVVQSFFSESPNTILADDITRQASIELDASSEQHPP